MSAIDPMMDRKTQLFNTRAALISKNMSIIGDEHQVLHVTLQPGEEIIAEPGCMMSSDVQIMSSVNVGTCADRCFQQCCAGESGIRIHWENTGQDAGSITLAPTLGKVVPVNLDERGGQMFITAGAFMATTDPDMDFEIERTSGSAAVKAAKGGSLFYLKVTGEGYVFLNSAGAIFQRYLDAGESMVCDRGHILAWDATIKRGSRRTGGIDMFFCGGEGLTNAVMTGPGLVILNSAPQLPVKKEGQ